MKNTLEKHHNNLVNLITDSLSADYSQSRLLLAIASFAKFDGAWKAFPSIETLRKMCGYQDGRNVRVVLAQLKAFGLISIYRRHKASNLYTIHPTRIASFNPARHGLRKIKDRATSALKKIILAAKKFLESKKQASSDTFMDHKEADRIATQEARAIELEAKKQAHASEGAGGPSKRALEMIAEAKRASMRQARPPVIA